MKLTEIKRQTAKHILVFGPPKSGKSFLVGGLAEKYNLKWFDLENGRNVLYQLPREWQERIDIFAIPDTKDFPIAAETLAHVLKGGACKICWTHGKVGCAICAKAAPNDFSSICLNEMKENEILVIDSTTQWSNSIMSHIGRGKDDMWKPEWNDYRTQGSMLDRGLSTIQNAPWNCILISHELEVDMEDGKKKLVPVAGTTNFSRNTAKYFDEVVYCEVKNRKHVAGSSTTYAPNVLTGSRTGVETEKGEKPSLLKIFEGIGQETEKTEVTMLRQIKQEIAK